MAVERNGSWWGRRKAASDSGRLGGGRICAETWEARSGAEREGVALLTPAPEEVIPRISGKPESAAGGALSLPFSAHEMGLHFLSSLTLWPRGKPKDEFRSRFSRMLCPNGAVKWNRRL